MTTETNRANPTARRRGQRPWNWPLLVVLLSVGSTLRVASADSLVPQGEPAPDFSLETLDGKALRLSTLRGKTVLLLFGELYNQNSLEAAKEVAGILAQPAMTDTETSAFMIVTQKAGRADLLADAQKKGITLPVLHDPDRRAFATYQVMVLPSLIIVDDDGRVVLASAGYPLDFVDMVTDTLLYAAGRLARAEFDHRREAEMAAAPEEHVRARRLAALGEQLSRRGAEELAISSFRDAISLHPDCVPAQIGLGASLFNRGELAQAEGHFRRALSVAPDSVEAALGLISIQTARGGDELKTAQERLAELLRRLPNDARVLYHAAVVAEKSGDIDTALGQYKRATEVLLYGPQRKRGPG